MLVGLRVPGPVGSATADSAAETGPGESAPAGDGSAGSEPPEGFVAKVLAGFRTVLQDRRISGPLLVTHTKNDRAVGVAYPLASRIANDAAAALGDENDPYAGLGRNGAQRTPEANAGVPEGRRILLRIGVNLGDVIIEGNDLYGDGVNVAARLEQLAETGGICVSQNVYDQVKRKIDVAFEDMGPQSIKNILWRYRDPALA